MSWKLQFYQTLLLSLTLYMSTSSISQINSTPYNLRFKPLEETDLELIHTWVHRPFVKKWFEHMVMPWDEFQTTMHERLNSGILWIFIIQTNGNPIGCIGYYDANKFADGSGLTEPEGTYGIDLFIGEQEYLGKGYGTATLIQFIKKIMNDQKALLKPIHKIIVDPHTENIPALKMYTKLGFTISRHVDGPLYGKQYIMTLDPTLIQ